MIGQHGVWLVLAAIAIWWIFSMAAAIGRGARRLEAQAELAAPAPAPVHAAEVRRPRARSVPAAAVPARPAPLAQASAGQGFAALLRGGAGARTAVVLGEILAPPVSLR